MSRIWTVLRLVSNPAPRVVQTWWWADLFFKAPWFTSHKIPSHRALPRMANILLKASAWLKKIYKRRYLEVQKVLQWGANNLKRLFECEIWSIRTFKGLRHGITCESRDYFSVGLLGTLMWVRVWRPWGQRQEAFMKVQRWTAHTNKASEKDVVHRRLTWKRRERKIAVLCC